MSPRSVFSLRSKILIPMVLLWSLLCIFLVGLTNHRSETALRVQLEQRAQSLLDALQMGSETVERRYQLNRLVAALGNEPGINQLMLIAGSPASVFASTHALLRDVELSELPDAHARAVILDVLMEQKESRHFVRGQHYEFAIPLYITNSRLTGQLRSVGVAYLQLDVRSLELQRQSDLREQATWVVAAISFIALLLGWMLHQLVLTPLKRLNHALQDDDPQQALNATNESLSGEFGRLGQTLSDQFGREIEYRQRLATIINHIHEGLIIVDDQGIIHIVNPASCTLLGYPEERLLGHNVRMLFADEATRIRMLELRRLVFSKNEDALPPNLDITALHSEGHTLQLELSPSRVPIDGTLMLMASLRDVTQRREQLRLMREAKESAESASRAKGEFIATISHEIRTPMNGVIGMAQLLKNTSLSSQQSDYIKTLQSSAQILLSLLNDTLDFSKIESGMLTLEAIDFNWEQVALDVHRMLLPKAREKGLELVLYIAPDVPLQARGDVTRIRQVLTNLIGNAVKFTHQGYVLTELEIEFSDDQQADYVLRVSDSGIGMSAVQLGKLFTPFSQADSSTTRRYGGTGLGLSISKRLIELMSGSIGVHSLPDQGSTFEVKLRLPCLPAVTLPDLTGRNILLLSDQPVSRQNLALFLRGCGAKVKEGEPTFADLESLQRHGWLPDILFIDSDAWTRWQVNGHGEDNLGLQCIPIAFNDAPPEKGNPWLIMPIQRAQLFHLLLGTPMPAEASAAEASPQNLQLTGRLLLVEDTEINQAVIRAMLGPLGLEIGIANNGVEALQMFQESRWNLVLMDCLMPVMDGFEATRQIRALERERELPATPIIALTANAYAQAREQCLEAGMDAFLTKPVIRDELINTLAHYLDTLDQALPEPLGCCAAGRSHDYSAVLGLLADELGDDTLHNLINSFIAQAGSLIDKARHALESQDASALRQHLVSLQKASSTLELEGLRVEIQSLLALADTPAGLTRDNLSTLEEHLSDLRDWAPVKSSD
ncbi:hybrid sensor histidine kinase/response regulator [Atopomonas sediminilitoris]|uniref:hybrid sensor histidine kinase/response regulator n=1 Tax=Atopomonas sediminilitoris TaxID=2919919 RepID=UPI001F4D492B|nr:ATP-binding protein [Atopomonas sediminilitoris]MCJ8169612.1 ATP-binding protein [Atopomonas sediminilitoris]